MTVSEFISKLSGVRRSGSQVLAKCPNHDDRQASLAISEGTDGRILLHCHAGCTPQGICEKLGIGLRDLFNDSPAARQVPARRIVDEYSYLDTERRLRFQTVRFDPKGFSQRRPNGTGWKWTLDGIELLPYRLPDFLDKDAVAIVEGEKDVDNCWKQLGFPATCNPMGAGKWRADYNQHFNDKHVIVIPDNDATGEQHARMVAQHLLLPARSVKILRLPGLPPKGDLSDWIANGGTRADFARLVANCPAITSADIANWTEPKRTATGFKLTRLGDLMAEPEEKIDWTVEGLLPAGGMSILVAKPKVGKSTLARCLALAVARGERFLGRTTSAGPVLYLALEEKRSEVKRHFTDLGATGQEEIFIHAEHAPVDAVTQARVIIDTHKPVLMIVDPVLKFARLRDANDYAQVNLALEPLLILARQSGAHILLVYHSGKGDKADAIDAALGSTAFAAAVDTQLWMKRGDRYRTLVSVQRYGQDLPETVLDFDHDRRAVYLGASKADAELERVKKEIASHLATATTEQEEVEILAAIEARRGLKQAALRGLVDAGQVTRSGAGKKGDPYRYRLADEFSFSGSHYMPGTTKPESQNSVEPTDSKEQILVPDSLPFDASNHDTREPESGESR